MISDADIKRIETELAAKFKEVFVTELQAGGFQLVTDAARPTCWCCVPR